MTHAELCEATAKKFVQTFALWEVKGKWENPDVITWNSSGKSIVYEIKMSRSDFLADFKKKCRQADHKKAGWKFYYVCYGDFIKKEDVPENWGIIHYIDGKFKVIKNSPCDWEHWDEGSNPDRDWQGEVIMLVNFILCHKYFNQQRYCFNKRYFKYEALMESVKEMESNQEKCDIQ